MTFEINGKNSRKHPAPASACAPSCASTAISGSRRAATPATAGPARCCRRRAGAQLPDPGVPRRGPRGHHDRRAWPATSGAAPDAAGVPRRAGLPVRVLHRRHGHDRGHAEPRSRSAGPAAAPQGQPVPLHRLSRHRGRARAARPTSRTPRAGEPPFGRSLPRARRPPRWSRARALHAGLARDGLLHLKLLRSPHAARPDRRRSTRRPRWPFPACMAVLTHGDAPRRCSRPRSTRLPRTTRTTPACSTTSCGSSASGWPPSSPRPRRPPKRAAARSRSTTRSCPPCSTPRQAMRAGRAAGPRRQDAGDRGSPTPRATSSPKCTVRSATSQPRCARGRRRLRGT